MWGGAWADVKVWDRGEAGRPREVWSRAGIGSEPSAPDPRAGNNGQAGTAWLAALGHVGSVFRVLPASLPGAHPQPLAPGLLQADFFLVAVSIHPHSEA